MTKVIIVRIQCQIKLIVWYRNIKNIKFPRKKVEKRALIRAN